MITRNKILTLFVSTLVVLNLSFAFTSSPSFAADTKVAAVTKEYKTVDALELVDKPQTYLNTPVKIDASFDKFTALGLDYKPAFRDSKKFIGISIRRPDAPGQHVIPLSELKLLMPRDKAEKLIDLEGGDQIELTCTVFSTALNDPWVEVDNIKVISSKSLKTASKKAGQDDTTSTTAKK